MTNISKDEIDFIETCETISSQLIDEGALDALLNAAKALTDRQFKDATTDQFGAGVLLERAAQIAFVRSVKAKMDSAGVKYTSGKAARAIIMLAEGTPASALNALGKALKSELGYSVQIIDGSDDDGDDD